MKHIFLIPIAIAVAVTSVPVAAQFGKLLGMPASGQADGVYKSKHQIRTYATSGAYDEVDLFRAVLKKAAEMTRAKSFPRFAVTKKSCTMFSMGGTPRAKSCILISQMLGEAEEASAKGKNPVTYYIVSEVLSPN